MLDQMIQDARQGKPLYITHLRERFLECKSRRSILLVLDLLQSGGKEYFEIFLPGGKITDEDQVSFLRSYVLAEIYNLLSVIGGRKLTVFIDKGDSLQINIAEAIGPAFHLQKPLSQRTGYGNCINVIDRMIRAIHGEGQRFVLAVEDHGQRPRVMTVAPQKEKHPGILVRAARDLAGKAICGIDIGGTDIKVAMAMDGKILCFKEFDWNPAAFTRARQLIDPILDLTSLVTAYATCKACCGDEDEVLCRELEQAMDREAPIQLIRQVVEKAKLAWKSRWIKLDAVGVSFPDVVVKDKIVGGETTKTRSMKRNLEIDYEEEFALITGLDKELTGFCREGGEVKIINDGPMSAYTAAVEMAAVLPDKIKNGMFAHSLGTEIGTGWVNAEGEVPEIPLECYNMIIDLGSFPSADHPPEDVRSIRNVNTGLAGSLQRYTSQFGVFRLAVDLFEAQRPRLYREILEKGFLEMKQGSDRLILSVSTEPRDMRKAFLEHIMALPDREKDPVVDEIFRQIGVYMAMVWRETEILLRPACKERALFGRMVKNPSCYRLIAEGARSVETNIVLEVADNSMANTILMKQLEADSHYTVAQFAQAVGAIYYGNQGLLK